ncbi:MAG: cupin [Candidatus Brennerbacteria bacterium CG11_big_fil_rev_8_21_14_0_20_43_10]|uniref:Cupin domain-containing protein n=3 Tax=Candidatus Brenneribacteriota TaxID=1817902 RepID=A0A2M8C3K6_9BACT|nr:MAG: cupin [Parcubacteria group bacterium CG1_02_44_31]PIP50209.1 MAG: cupin [Candidatus Brennerbacteria bacterium CG23_combo_of_CG06-09_8_20_14_all_44_41]PIR26260.1 MAG: cupin [Candidatus Brennerbacteria bacterium CG11_big_fil_rev_8_21_14_0_20_43_10]PIX29026.1 MAG: cupin domain-containing protein [Candidatus Brennerbacteria bacterium CG_4_8_14_3_um_filter_43_14]PJA19376.1 MAG: cupin domain-containing protein [Candidatus Brennerbacteria bacterium CG_4_10_14_0_2_um_filter_43_14]PJB50670.1 MA
MRGYIINLEEKTQENNTFRTVLYTTRHSQLVVMSLLPGQDIGSEIHKDVDQFIRVERGQGKAILNNEEHDLRDGYAVMIPAGTEHNIINTQSSESMKLYTVYSPPEHKDKTVHETKEEALTHEEHFDGSTT